MLDVLIFNTKKYDSKHVLITKFFYYTGRQFSNFKLFQNCHSVIPSLFELNTSQPVKTVNIKFLCVVQGVLYIVHAIHDNRYHL